MVGMVTLERALKSSVFHLAAERRRLEEELLAMEMRMAGRSGSEAATLDEQMAAHRAALTALEREAEAERQAERAAAAEAAAKAARERLTGHERALVDAHEGKLASVATREEAAERAAASAMAIAMNVSTQQLSLSPTEFVHRLAGGISRHLMQLSIVHMRRLGALVLLDDPHARTAASWRDREAKNTSPSVETLLAHAEGGMS
jgi:hypothetical protein